MTRSLLALVPLLALSFGASAAKASAPTTGDSKVWSAVPSPGFPEGIAARGNRVYVSGPAAFGQPLGSAFVQSYRRSDGAPLAQYPIDIVNPMAGMSGASCLRFGPDGALYVVEPFVGIIRMELNAANDQSVHSAFVPTGASLLNDLDFDDDGNLYVSDSFAAAVYRIPAAGGPPELWFQDDRLAGHPEFPFGVNGLRVHPNGECLYLSVTADASFDGVIYHLPLVEAPQAGDLQHFASLGPTGPDGIEFGRGGRLFVAEALTSTISVLDRHGALRATYHGPAADGAGGSVAWANPANLVFDRRKRRLLVTNHASLVPYDPSLFVVFELSLRERDCR